MSKFHCECGFVISTVGDNNPYEGYLFSNQDVDDEDEIEKIDIIMDSIDVLECTECGRLHIQNERRKNHYVSFIPENGKYNSILSE